MDLEALLTREEGKQLEFKRNLDSIKPILKTIVAFANTAGGTLLVGVEDKIKKVVGVEDPLGKEEKLANLIADGISPMLAPGIEIISWRNSQILKVEVSLSSSRPHYLKKEGLEQGTYVRVGSTNRRMDSQMIEEIRREVHRKPFDETAMPEFSSEVIDFAVASELFESKKAISKKDLETLNLVVAHQRKKVPTVAGIILFGKNRDTVFPDAWIQCGVFKGTTKSKIMDTVEVRTYPVLAITEVLDFVKKHSNLAYEIEGLARTEVWSKPLTALREALINAVIHADYSQIGAPIRLSIFEDRVEIENPGLLVSGLTIDEIEHGVSKLRNKAIARVFKELGLVEQWGSGVSRIIESCEEYGLPAPKFEEIATHFRVTLYTSRVKKPIIDDTDSKILELLAKGKQLQTGEISKAIDLSPKATVTRLNKLLSKNLVRVIGKSQRDPKRKYTLGETYR